MTYKIPRPKEKEQSKDWKRIEFSDGSYYYKNKKRKGNLHIGERNVSIEIDTVKIGKASLPKTHIYEEFKSHDEALKYANKYMKKH